MYIYFGLMYYNPYAIYKAFFLVVETEFRLGAQVRAFWQWTVDGQGNENQDKLCWETVNKVDDTNYPTGARTFGIFYDLYYPFDLVVDDDNNKIALTMYEYPKSDPNCREIANFDLSRVYSCRTTAADYNPVRALPVIRYYQLGYWM